MNRARFLGKLGMTFFFIRLLMRDCLNELPCTDLLFPYFRKRARATRENHWRMKVVHVLVAVGLLGCEAPTVAHTEELFVAVERQGTHTSVLTVFDGFEYVLAHDGLPAESGRAQLRGDTLTLSYLPGGPLTTLVQSSEFIMKKGEMCRVYRVPRGEAVRSGRLMPPVKKVSSERCFEITRAFSRGYPSN